MKNFGKSSREHNQGVSKISRAPIWGALRGHLCDSTAFLLLICVWFGGASQLKDVDVDVGIVGMVYCTHGARTCCGRQSPGSLHQSSATPHHAPPTREIAVTDRQTDGQTDSNRCPADTTSSRLSINHYTSQLAWLYDTASAIHSCQHQQQSPDRRYHDKHRLISRPWPIYV